MSDVNQRETTIATFTCPKCGKRQHPYQNDIAYTTYHLTCKYCGNKWEHTILSHEERIERQRKASKKYKEAHKKDIKEYMRQYRIDNASRIRYQRKRYREKKRLEQPKYKTRNRPVAVCDKITMDVLEIYESAKYATLYDGYDEESIKQACVRKLNNKGSVVYRYADEVDVNESFDGKKWRPLKLIDTQNDTYKVFYSVVDAAKSIYVSTSRIYDSINNGRLISYRYRAEYMR